MPWSATRAQTARRVPRVTILFYGTPANSRARRDALLKGLKELGYDESRLRCDWRYANGQPDLVDRQAHDLLRETNDVIVSFSTANTEALHEAGVATPVVMIAVDDPVRSHLAHDLARPGANFTGITSNAVPQAGRYVELLAEAAGKPHTIGLLASPASSTYRLFRTRVEEEAARRAIRVSMLDIPSAEELDRVLGRAAPTLQGLIVTSDAVLYNERRRIVELVADSRVPAIYPRFGYVEVGGLMSYGPSDERLATRAAKFVTRILEGESPESMPIEGPIVYELAINRKTASAMGLALPASLTRKADRLVG